MKIGGLLLVLLLVMLSFLSFLLLLLMLSFLSKRNANAINLPSVLHLLHFPFYYGVIFTIIAYDSSSFVVVKFDWLLSCTTLTFTYVFM